MALITEPKDQKATAWIVALLNHDGINKMDLAKYIWPSDSYPIQNGKLRNRIERGFTETEAQKAKEYFEGIKKLIAA